MEKADATPAVRHRLPAVPLEAALDADQSRPEIPSKARRAKAVRAPPAQTDNYFLSDKDEIKFTSSGCMGVDCALGGGYALGRITNIIGDASSCKTALACEAVTNFLKAYPKGRAAYRDVEAAFDQKYAAAMGLPIDEVDFGATPLNTVEEFYKDMNAFVDARIADKKPGIYVLDSLDALSDEAELGRDISKGSFEMTKQKKLSSMFRQIVRKLSKSEVLLLVVSQVRDNIGVTFGERHRRSGGKWLDFYSSQFLWLAHAGHEEKAINNVKRTIGINVRAKVKKNKIGFAHRSFDFTFLFGFGIDDLNASVDWLTEVGRPELVMECGPGDAKAARKRYDKRVDAMTDDQYKAECERVAGILKETWAAVETTFLPKRRKY